MGKQICHFPCCPSSHGVMQLLQERIGPPKKNSFVSEYTSFQKRILSFQGGKQEVTKVVSLWKNVGRICEGKPIDLNNV